jgi:hypothetical protein
MRIRAQARRGACWFRYGVAVALGLYLVGRAIIELTIVDPARTETYRQDWGGPHYLGVILVHAGPAVLVVLFTVLFVRRRNRAKASRRRGPVDG